MTDQEMMALEQWQMSQAGAADRKLYDLAVALDDLTSLAQTRNGAKVIQANREILKDALRKLYDLFLDTQPALQAAE